MIETIQDNRRFWGIGEVLKLSLPAGASMLSSTLMRFVDGVLVSFTGPAPLAAQFVAGMAAFVPESFATGVLTVVNTFVSQNFGAGRHDRCGQYAWAALSLAFFFCLCIAPLALLAGPVFHILQQQADLLDLEVMYFRYMVLAVFLTLMARPIEQFFYGIHRPAIVMRASILVNVLNIVLGYILIFGRSGLIVLQKWNWTTPLHDFLVRMPFLQFEGMGLEGSAIATVTSWGLYLLILASVFLSTKLHSQYGTRFARRFRGSQLWDILRLGWPPGLQFINDFLPWFLMLAWLIGSFGKVHAVASTIAMRWIPLSFMPAVGIGVATTALVGRYIGQRQPLIARRRVHAALILALLYMGSCGLLFFLLRGPMVSFFISVVPTPDMSLEQARQMADQIVMLGGYIMICAAIFQLFDAVGIVYIGGLRGAGDTFWPMVITIGLSWGILVGGGYGIARLAPQLGSIGPWIAGTVYVILMGIAVACRFESGAWKKIGILGERGGPSTAGEGALPGMSPPHK